MEENIPLPQILTSCLKQNMDDDDDDQLVASITGEDNIAHADQRSDVDPGEQIRPDIDHLIYSTLRSSQPADSATQTQIHNLDWTDLYLYLYIYMLYLYMTREIRPNK